jgi:hypothetical protein
LKEKTENMRDQFAKYSKSLTAALVDSMIGKLPGSAGGVKAPLQGLKNTPWHIANPKIRQFVKTQPGLLGVYNEASGEIGPKMDQYGKLARSVKEAQLDLAGFIRAYEKAQGKGGTGIADLVRTVSGDVGVAGDIRPEPKKKKRSPSGAVKDFQGTFNRAIMETPYAEMKLKVDGIWGKNTARAANFVKKVTNKEKVDLLAFDEEMEKLREKAPEATEIPSAPPTAPEAPPPTKEEALKLYDDVLTLLERKYPRLEGKIKGSGDEWRRVRSLAFKLAGGGKYTPEQIANVFTVERMNKLRKTRPYIPRATPGR